MYKRQGIAYVPSERKQDGLILSHSVKNNMTLANLRKYNRGYAIDSAAETAAARGWVDTLDIKTPGLGAAVDTLSGGNQQKVVISKWILRDCDVLIFDEPTRGIDVGAKSEIYKLMTQLAEEGKSIIMISSDMPELLRLSDRVIVMCEGHVTGELDISEATQETIMTYATKREVG